MVIYIERDKVRKTREDADSKKKKREVDGNLLNLKRLSIPPSKST
jgi:hypothetical protein